MKDVVKMSDIKRLKNKIKDYLKRGKGIFAVDLYTFAKKNGIKKALVKEALESSMPFMINKSYGSKLNPRRNYFMPVRCQTLGHIFFDLAFFPKPTGKNIVGFFVYVELLSKRVYTTLLYNSKNADNCIKSFKSFIRKYKNDYDGRVPVSVTSDREPTLFAEKVRNYFLRQKIQIIYLSNNKNKSFMAENRILALKRLYGQMREYDVQNQRRIKPMDRMLQSLTDTLNNRYISINNITGKFKPKTISHRNFKKYIEWLNNVDYIRQFDTYQFRDDVYRFKFEINQPVKFKVSKLSFNVETFKRSLQSLSNSTFRVKKRFLFLARSHALSPGYLLEAITTLKKRKKADVEKLTFAKEVDLVRYSRPNELHRVSRK